MTCPVCLNSASSPALVGTDFLFETTSKTFTLHSCAACRCLFLNPMPGSDEIHQFYPPQYWWSAAQSGLLKRLEGVYRRVALRGHVSFITQITGRISTADLLDVGCGSGTLIGLLKNEGINVIGIDFSGDAARVAWEENGVRVIVGSLLQVGFSDESFDVVTLFHVLEHVPNPREILTEVFRILRPGGSLVVQVPNIDSWQFKLFGARWYGLDIPRHVVDYSGPVLLQLLADCGLTPRRVRHFNLRDNAPALASSLFPSLDPVSRVVRQRSRHVRESTIGGWFKHTVYLLIVVFA